MAKKLVPGNEIKKPDRHKISSFRWLYSVGVVNSDKHRRHFIRHNGS